jgi:hypothetical protein
MQSRAVSQHLPLLKFAGNAGLEVECTAAMRLPFPVVRQLERVAVYDIGRDLSNLRHCDLFPPSEHSHI